MNSYGDSSARGRARVSGPADGFDDPRGEGGGWPDNGGYGHGAAARPAGSSGGRAPVRGAASVGSPGGSATGTAGRARVGRAGVPGYDPPRGGTGRASVGAAPAGRATVGRAAVRPVSPAVGGPGGPGGTGPGRRGAGDRDPDAQRRRRRRRIINWAIAGFAVLIIAAGGGVVGFTYYSTKVTLPQHLNTGALSSQILFDDGKKVLGKLGIENRTLVKIDQIPEFVQRAVAAAEDRNFYQHSGVDYVGIARAAWNNFTGGSKQGASTITQQYARNAMALEGVTYARKLREAVLASKLNDQYGKPEIMEFYLNIIYLGRGAYGIEAASQTYFNKSVTKLTVSEAAVLAAVIKQPEPEGDVKGFDPALDPQAAKDRWGYVLDGMVQEKWLSQADRDKQVYPAPYDAKTKRGSLRPPPSKDACTTECGFKSATGNVINYVVDELIEKGICARGDCLKALRTGGYKITTTIDQKTQSAAEFATHRVKGSPMAGQPNKLQAALVAINPKNGRVMAYYGGDDATGYDYAGVNTNAKTGALEGGHSPASSFKIYTLAAALEAGYSMKSLFDPNKNKDPERRKSKISNAGRDSSSCGKSCTLREMTLKSYNVPFYWITKDVGPAKVLEAAQKAGVRTMWPNSGPAVDLTKVEAEKVAPSKFDVEIGYGQYGITVLDHANGVATLANRGMHNRAHFILKVEKKNIQTGKYDVLTRGAEQLKAKRAIGEEIVDDITHTLNDYTKTDLGDGRDAAGKTGTWELNETAGKNGDAWMVGYTPQIASAVWVGAKGNRTAIVDKNGNDISGSGLPGSIWNEFMRLAVKDMEKIDFPDAANVGSPDKTAPGGEGEKPQEPPENQCALFPQAPQCQGNNGGGNNGGGNNGGGNNGGGNGGPGNGPGGGGNNGGGNNPTVPPPPNTDD